MKRYRTLLLGAAALVVAGCKDNPVVNPIDAPTVDAVSLTLNPTTLQQLATGVLGQDRNSANVFAYAIEAGIFGRDVYRIDASAPRFVHETLKALDYWRVIEYRDTVGMAIQSDDPAAVTDIKCKETILAYIAAVLDSANSDLTAAGATTELPFTLPTGYTAFGRDYSVVSNIIKFNRGLKGKVDFYRGLDRKAYTASLFPTAITEL